MAPSSENPPAASAVTSADASSSKSAVVKKMKTTSKAAPKTTHARFEDVVLPGEEAGEVAVFDCCTTIRKKITQFLGEGNKAAQFLRDLGGINTNALARAVPFKPESGPNGGASNQICPAAYKFFEKKRIFECKPKTPSRLNAEKEFPNGRELEQRRRMWIMH